MTTYREQLIQWAEHGSLYPHFAIHPQSEPDLTKLTAELQDGVRGFEPFDDYHVSIAYIHVKSLLGYLQSHTSPQRTISPECFYADLASVYGTILLAVRQDEVASVATDGLGYFGAAEDVVALRLRWPEFKEVRSLAISLLKRVLSDYGFSNSHFKDMARRPDFYWLFRDSAPHISLGSVAIANADGITSLSCPESIVIQGLRARANEPAFADPRWYILPGYDGSND